MQPNQAVTTPRAETQRDIITHDALANNGVGRGADRRNSPSAAVELRNVTRVYGSRDIGVVALDDVSVAFPSGSWTAVMGPSGSGKSTLLHSAGGLEKVSSGQVLVDGQDITNLSEKKLTGLRRTVIGFVFQNFNLIGSLTAEQNVAMPLKLAGQRPSRRDVRAVLDKVGLGDRLRHKPRELSGGQQQRVAIARALVTKPTVLLADEPTGALDSNAARTVLGMMRSMVDDGQTIVMVTHDPLAASSADQVLFLSDGQVVDRLVRPSVHDVAERLARLEA
jgi:putative ABC transport system ATP-binding protein